VNNVEMGVKGGGFINGSHGQVHEGRQGPETGHGKVTVGVLQGVQVLNQAVTVTLRRVRAFIANQAP
jgi:hypothetical protein